MLSYVLNSWYGWKTYDYLCCLIIAQLNQTPLDQLECWNQLNLALVLDELKHEFEQVKINSKHYFKWSNFKLLLCFFVKVLKSIQDQPLIFVIKEIKNSFELISLNLEYQSDNKLFKQLQFVVDNLFVVLYSHCILQSYRSVVIDDRFRCEKRFSIWNSLMWWIFLLMILLFGWKKKIFRCNNALVLVPCCRILNTNVLLLYWRLMILNCPLFKLKICGCRPFIHKELGNQKWVYWMRLITACLF